jgi:hypothetical protein
MAEVEGRTSVDKTIVSEITGGLTSEELSSDGGLCCPERNL